MGIGWGHPGSPVLTMAATDDDEARMLLRLALLNGVPWTLAAEAASSVALSRDDEVGTYSLEEEP